MLGVDEWLQMNKTCPFCKRSIDATELKGMNQDGQSNAEPTTQETPHDVPAFDGRVLGNDFDNELAVAIAMSLAPTENQ